MPQAGKLGNAALSAATNATIYTVPSSTVATITAAFVNRSGTNVSVRLALATTDTPTLAEYVEYDVVIPANGVLERTGLVVGAGEKVVAYASAGVVSVRIFGFEEAA